MNLTIITPCSRPENLVMLRQSINFPCKWIIVYDSDFYLKRFQEDWITETAIKGGVSGNLQRNTGIELAEADSWLYFLDDDNTIHPNFFGTVATYSAAFSSAEALVFDQQMSQFSYRKCGPSTTKATHIDQAQYMVKKSFVGNLRFIQDYCADGVFIEALFKTSPEKFKFIDQPLCYYNKLRW